MLTHDLMVATRYLVRARLFTLINVLGLATAIAAALLIGLWVRDELAFNKSFDHYDNIAQVYHTISFGGELMTINDVPAAIGQAIKTRVAGVSETVMSTWPRELVVANEETALTENVLFAEPAFAKVFSLKMLHGTNSLADLNSVLISRQLADKLFSGDAHGRMLRLADRDNMIVAGVFEDFPSNSTFAEVHVIASLSYHFKRSPGAPKPDDWETYIFQCFLLLDGKSALGKMQDEMETLLLDHASNDGKALQPKGLLLPMRDWHLRSEFKSGKSAGGRIQLVRMLGLVSLVIIVLACVNFINLTTARSETRSKEIGVRKVLGSHHRELIRRFFMESLMLVLIASAIAVLVTLGVLPWFNDLSGKQLTMPGIDGAFWGLAVVFMLLVSALSGVYPALFLASRKVTSVLKKSGGSISAGGMNLRKAMVVFQFVVSVVLIVGTMVIFSQIQHARNRPVGFDTKGIIHIAIRSDQLAGVDYNTIRHNLLATGVVENMAKSDFPITGPMAGDASIRWEGMDPVSPPLFTRNRCSHDFPATHGFQFVAGRDFSRDHSSDSSAVIINEMAAKLIGGEVLGKKINFGYGVEREIIGVIRDQIRWTPYREQTPHLYYVSYEKPGYFSIRLKPEVGLADGVRDVEAVFHRFAPGAPFDYAFVDDDFNRLFLAEERAGKIAFVFSVLAILISCIGIFGLAAFSAAQRTREIGIRKVLGASTFGLWKLLSIDFLWLSLIAALIAGPIAYYAALKWLEQFTYRIDVSWIVFVIATLITLFVTLTTVSYQTIRAAYMNPVQSLKIE